ncbi:MAG: VWA domain-containing protein [Chloroflexi bacterium]|nr:VWA domain-containing protein [Chloroflexota bacterium]
MNTRLLEFVAALRAAGVRISMAESADALRAIDAVGVSERALFKTALKATLVKEHNDEPAFEQFFPQYFGGDPQGLQQPQNLSKEEQEQLERALDELREQLRQLMQMLANGERPSDEQLQEQARRAGMRPGLRADPRIREWIAERMQRQMGLTPQQLRDAIEALMKQLKEQGMSPEARAEVRSTVRENAQSVREQVEQFVGRNLMQQPDDSRRRSRIDDLMDQPLSSLSESEADELRAHVRTLVARLRSRAALRMRRGARRNIDVRATLRRNQRYLGVPLELQHRKHTLKPKITIIVDVSTSMRPVAEFMLHMVYELQDQIAKARSFAFISDLLDVSMIFQEFRPAQASEKVLTSLPPGHYNTDLGAALATFVREHGDAVDRRTTLIFVGDARNNYNDPRVDLMQSLLGRARRVIWFNPEPPAMWGSGDSDMLQYAPISSVVHQVATLQQLSDAIDNLFQAH